MEQMPPEVTAAHDRLRAIDDQELAELQAIASRSVGLRYGFQDVWSIALRAGIEWALDQSQPLPENPFTASAMSKAGHDPVPF